MAHKNVSIEEMLGDEADSLLNHVCKTIPKEKIHTPSPNYVEEIWYHADRNNRVLFNLSRLLNSGRLAGTGYLSILPVDQGIEHRDRKSTRLNSSHVAISY